MEKKRDDIPANSGAPVKVEPEESVICGHTCGVCSRSFPLLSSLSQHMRSHTQEKPYKCPHCQYRTAQKGSLKNHIRSHKLGLFQQRLSDKNVELSEEQKNILEIPKSGDTELEKTTFIGKVKRKGSKRRNSEADVMEAEADRGCCTCIICDQAFPDMLLLKSHMKVHGGPEDYGCRLCGRRFRQAWSLQSHVYTHRSKARPKGDRPSKSHVTINGVPQEPASLVNEVCLYELCSTCGNFFPDRASLQIHEALHQHNSSTLNPPQEETDVSDSQSKSFFMESLGLTSVKAKKTRVETSPGGQMVGLDPCCSYQTLMLSTKGRLTKTHLPKKPVAQDTNKVKRMAKDTDMVKHVSSKQGKKRKQVTTSDSQNKKLKLETNREQPSKIESQGRSGNKKSNIPLGLGHAFYKELHSKTPKEVPTGNSVSTNRNGIKVYFCQHCNFRTGSSSILEFHRYTMHPDHLDPQWNYFRVPTTISQIGLENLLYTEYSQTHSGQVIIAGIKGPRHANDTKLGALNLSLLNSNHGDLFVKKNDIIRYECSFCTHTSYYPEVLWMHQQIEHKVYASCPMAPKWAVSNSSLKSLKAVTPKWRRTGPPPFLKGKDCPALSIQKSQRTKPQGTTAKDRHASDQTQSSRQTGSMPQKKAKHKKQTVELGGNTSGVPTSSTSAVAFNKNTSRSQPTSSPNHHRSAADANFPQEGLGFMLARHHSGMALSIAANKPRPRRNSADSSSGPNDLDPCAALNMLSQKAYSEPPVAPIKADSAEEHPGDIDILGLLRTVPLQWNPRTRPVLTGNVTGNGCPKPPSGSLSTSPSVGFQPAP
ncbi:Zinc finger protein 516 [Takifugu flavidus]|uniref:Zinc finger protein 516 n=1 Tax=Takifugu flavidus TaxID=433684 RepID=A0A5C6NDU1_9TELE|nr:Zinc finger protein 516 [Takifugu flavidus]